MSRKDELIALAAQDRINAHCKCSGVDVCGYHRSRQFAEDYAALRAIAETEEQQP